MRHLTMTLATLSTLLLGAAPAFSADFEIQLLNKGEAGSMVFEPAFLEIAPGDTVTFVATNPGHNAQAIDGMIPEGAEAFKGPFSKDFSVTFDTAGVYGIKCTPHYSMGMVAMVAVGEATNLDAAKAVSNPPKAQEKFDAMFADLAAN